MSALLAQASTFNGPEIDWWALSPLLVLVGGGLALLVASALTPRWPKGAYAAATVTTASAALVLAAILWFQVQDDGPAAAGRRGAAPRRLQPLPHHRHLPVGHPQLARRRRLPPAQRHGGQRALRAVPHGRRRRHRHGLRRRSHRAVPRPRDAVHRPVRDGRQRPAPPPLAGVGHEVLRAGRLRLGLLPLRHRADLRRHGHDQPRRHLRVPADDGAARGQAAAGRHGPPARRASGSRPRRCRSTGGRPTSTRVRPRRSPGSSPRRPRRPPSPPCCGSSSRPSPPTRTSGSPRCSPSPSSPCWSGRSWPSCRPT